MPPADQRPGGGSFAYPTSSSFSYPSAKSFYDDETSEATAEREEVGVGGLPSEAQLVLLCLDYLRDLRRSYHDATELSLAEGLDADYVSVAIWALTRAFIRPPQLLNAGGGGHGVGNDAWFDPARQVSAGIGLGRNKKMEELFRLSDRVSIPSLEVMNREILYLKSPLGGASSPENMDPNAQSDGISDPTVGVNDDPASWYPYDDSRLSNSHRFYHLNGLASGPATPGPLTLGEITAAGLAGLGARSRLDAEREMVKSPLFEQFVSAVRAKGFFRDVEEDTMDGPGWEGKDDGGEEAGPSEEERRRRASAAYEERYRKVVAKFRTKLATKAEQQAGSVVGGGMVGGSPVVSTGAEAGGGGMTPVPSPRSAGGSSVVAAASRGPPLSGNLLAMSAAERQRRRRRKRIEGARIKRAGVASPERGMEKERAVGAGRASEEYYEQDEMMSPTPQRSGASRSAHVGEDLHTGPEGGSVAASVASHGSSRKLASSPLARPYSPAIRSSFSQSPALVLSSSSGHPHNQIDLDEAERLKAAGNAHMQNKEYSAASEAYTTALKLSPAGPNSHVYFSNRAAALLSMKKFHDAILDSERSLALKPEYGKAHARLGLAHFLLGNYKQAIEAYTVSLKYEPDNKSSKGYLEKAKKKFAQQEKKGRGTPTNAHDTASHGCDTTVDASVDHQSLDQTRQSETRSRGGDADASPDSRPRRRGSEGQDGAQSPSSQRDGRQQQKQRRSQRHRDRSRESNSDAISVASSAVEDQAERQRIIDQKEADRLKSAGNTYMASREYQLAVEAYSAALRLCPAGPNSHVYFSNRAAALCYLERYEEAELDSERSLALRPDYGKAHARLGLSRFFLGDYEGAVDAYTAALKYDPNNAASKSYLAKARQKMELVMDGGINMDDDGDTIEGGGEEDGDSAAGESRISANTPADGVRGGGDRVAAPVTPTRNSGRGGVVANPPPPPPPLPPKSPKSPKSPGRTLSMPASPHHHQNQRRSHPSSPVEGGGRSSSRGVKPTPQDVMAEMDRIARDAKRGGDVSKSLARMMEDPDMMGMAKKMMEDPKMQKMAQSAMADPTMVDAMTSAMSRSQSEQRGRAEQAQH